MKKLKLLNQKVAPLKLKRIRLINKKIKENLNIIYTVIRKLNFHLG